MEAWVSDHMNTAQKCKDSSPKRTKHWDSLVTPGMHTVTSTEAEMPQQNLTSSHDKNSDKNLTRTIWDPQPASPCLLPLPFPLLLSLKLSLNLLEAGAKLRLPSADPKDTVFRPHTPNTRVLACDFSSSFFFLSSIL